MAADTSAVVAAPFRNSRRVFLFLATKGSTFPAGRAYPFQEQQSEVFPANPRCAILAVRAVMEQDLEELVARASDPRWIPAIYNYCDRRCARCRFSERCFAFDEEVRQGAPAQEVVEVASKSLGRSLRLLHGYAESEGLDLCEGDPGEAPARDAAEGDALVVAAHQYAADCLTLLNALQSQLGADAAIDVRDAIDSL